MPPRHPYTNFFNCHYFGKWALYFCFDLAKVFLQGATTPPLHSFLFGIIIVGRGNMLLLRLSQGISSGCHHANLTSKKVFFELTLLREGDIMLLLRLSQGISSECHHATRKPNVFFRNCHYCGKGALSFCFDLAKVFLQGAIMPHLHQIFFRNCHCGKGYYASAST